ncbi:YHS domain-containing (seleno)protein [Winogradskyella sp. 3972H.M.0a.05]|uniref:YHS domain-containing (seleno)protein n=1 Tax=Winogradskyella sp. 3972H.M.0a.05 TaxID=2950277 RepID=UPI0033941BCF
MKNIIKTMLLVMTFITAITVEAQDKKANNIDNSNIALQGYSPVSYLDLGIAQKGLKQYKSEHNKIVYYFTSEDQKKAFDSNPNKYLPQYGGYCAFGVYAGAKFRPDPNKFIVENGKYFLFLYNIELDAQQLWLAENNHKKLVATANKNWSKLKSTYN